MHATHPEMAERWEKHTSGDLPERAKMRQGAAMTAKLKLATPAGDVTAPTDRAGLRGKLTVINGEGGPRVAKLVAKMHDDTGNAAALRGAVADNKGRIPADEALYISGEERTAGTRSQRCAGCSHYQREGRRHQGKCGTVHPVGKPHRKLVVQSNGYCMLWSGMQKSESRPQTIVPLDRLSYRGKMRTVRTRKLTTIDALEKKLPYSTLPVTAPTHGSAPRWETPPIPDYQEIYFQPDSDERKKKDREHQITRKLATAKRNIGVYGFHGEERADHPELRYEPDESLSNPSIQNPTRPAVRKPIVKAPKLLGRLAAGSTSYTDPEERKAKKQYRKGKDDGYDRKAKRLVAKMTAEQIGTWDRDNLAGFIAAGWRNHKALSETYEGSGAGEAHPHYAYDEGPLDPQSYPKGPAPGSPPKLRFIARKK
jgi:hypothetical protein